MGKQPVNFNQEFSPRANSILRIPIIDGSQTRLWSKITSKLKPENHIQWITTDLLSGKNLFCVRVNSGSMWPNFEKDEVIFRHLIKDGQYKTLKALNPIFPPVELQTNDKIIGSVVEARCNF
ncbi:Uncharacterised protein [Legionella busanensis]|uniref:Peptidase S24/S26A/S26B/S26C domain-containing protein n=1 Tax=Legionella busanensis TaxID=190655 RepID=A0A378K9M0_9GAMM|nr:S24 family peptidase [Legionella busanensis]STX81406.1 Uncharacterised protein [Legionella busanensis]